MGWRLHYFALEITGGQAVRLHTFGCAIEAEDGARFIGRLALGAVAFQQWGNSVTGEWDAPDPLLFVGEVPRGALGDPAEIPCAA